MVKFSHSNNRSGFSLLELLLVVGVGAVLILAGLSAYKLVSDNNAANQGIRQLQTLKTQTQQAYQGETGYGTGSNQDLTATLQNMRMLPPDMPLNGTNLRNGFGGNTTVVSGTTTSTFVISFQNVSRTACARMGLAYTANNTADFVGVAVNGTTSMPNPTVATIATACNQDTNTLAWTFR